MRTRPRVRTLVLAVCVCACSEDRSSECVDIDEQLAEPLSRLWGDGEFSPPPWKGRVADRSTAICLAPEPDGSCKLCPRAEVVDEVEVSMREAAAERGCELEHWEFGCIRTVARAQLIDPENYCCYQVAQWGSGCKSDTAIDQSQP